MAPALPTPPSARRLNAETDVILCASTMTSTSEASPPMRTVPSQTGSRPLTTIFTPPPSCENRYYVEAKANEYDTERDIFSNTVDRLYRPCQPDPEAHDNYYSPGACPSNMEVATVLSSASDGTTDMTYTDICCQSGFVWDSQSCYSMVPTLTTVLVAPTVATLDEYVLVSKIQAWHPPIMAVWQTTDLSLFPSDVMSQKAYIVGYEWPPHPTSAGNRSEEPPDNESITGALSVPAIIAISIGIVLLIWLIAWIFSPPRKRREPSRSNSTVYTGPQQDQIGYTWKVEVGPPPPDQLDLQDIRPARGRQRKEETAAEIGSGSALTPTSNHGKEEDADIISPISSRA